MRGGAEVVILKFLQRTIRIRTLIKGTVYYKLVKGDSIVEPCKGKKKHTVKETIL
jgi:hypothetical protein